MHTPSARRCKEAAHPHSSLMGLQKLCVLLICRAFAGDGGQQGIQHHFSCLLALRSLRPFQLLQNSLHQSCRCTPPSSCSGNPASQRRHVWWLRLETISLMTARVTPLVHSAVPRVQGKSSMPVECSASHMVRQAILGNVPAVLTPFEGPSVLPASGRACALPLLTNALRLLPACWLERLSELDPGMRLPSA